MMDNKYSQGSACLQSVCVGDLLYKLDNGNYLRICDLCDDPEYEYGYDYFDGKTKKIIDGGVFSIDADTVEKVLDEAMSWADVDPNKTKYELIDEEADYSRLEELGFTGF